MSGREPFLLDPDVAYLNHGSFGACPRPVFEVYQAWQREFERERSTCSSAGSRTSSRRSAGRSASTSGRPLLRVSTAAYNTEADVDRLETALGAIF